MEVNTNQVPLSSTTIRSRPWRHLDIGAFRSALSTAQLCDPEVWPADVDEMAALYEELTGLLDRLLPERQFVRRPRSLDPWFDKEYREAKRLIRRLERAFAAASRRADTAYAVSTTAVAASVVKAAAAKAAWYNQRRSYRQLRRLKCAC